MKYLLTNYIQIKAIVCIPPQSGRCLKLTYEYINIFSKQLQSMCVAIIVLGISHQTSPKVR